MDNSLLGLVVLVLDVVAIIDIIQSSMNTTRKIIWILAVLIFPIVGMIVYFLIGKKAKI